MLRNRIWYRLKPYLPRALRMTLRRWYSRRVLRRSGDIWPILPGSERPPAGWPGWPEGRQFAFVLTHDVEGPQGLAKVKRLAELEMTLELRSSFNFIPEGPYRVPEELRHWLEERGFEVGVHDLHHDGHLFRNRAAFRENARKINRYLREWNAVGFRAGFMLQWLHWLHDLEIEYDASTFDTDPFEPMPHGAGMIFPYWVPVPVGTPGADAGSSPRAQRGYVELPYTLVQDSTLFLLLEANSPEIWLRKLDWIARNGGMALVNVHPDYLHFPDEPEDSYSFPVEHYCQLLIHVGECYAGRCWHALPREIAGFVRGLPQQPSHRRPRRVAMVTHSVYCTDNRVIRYAEALTEHGDDVEVLSLRSSPEISTTEVVNGVRVRRIQNRLSKRETGLLPLLTTTAGFFAKAAWHLTREHSRRPYDLIHVHNVPDFLVFTAWYPRLRGARVILDIHDILPEFFCARFRRSEQTLLFRFCLWMERWSARFADHIIISNDLWRPRYEARTGTAGRCSVFINYVNLNIFNPALRTLRNGSSGPVLMFPGGLQQHQGLDVAIRALPLILKHYPQAEFHIYGDGPMRQTWEQLARSMGLQDHVLFHPPLPAREIARKMAQADLGIVPKRAESFGDEAYSTKIMEFMALGVPVVISETRVDRYYFDDSLLRFFPSANPGALATAVLDALENAEATRQRVQRASEYAQAESWQARQADYLALVNRLCSNQKIEAVKPMTSDPPHRFTRPSARPASTVHAHDGLSDKKRQDW